MGTAYIPLQGMPAPRMNPYQAAVQGQEAALSARAMMQQEQMRNQQMQAYQLENQVRQQQWEDEQKLRQSFTESEGDMDKMWKLAAKRGVSPKAVSAGMAGWNNAIKTRAQVNLNILKNDQMRHDALRGMLQAFETLPEEQKTLETWQQKMQEAYQKGYLTSQEFTAEMDRGFPSPEERKAKALGLAVGSQLSKEAQKQQEIENRRKTADAAVTRAQTAKDALSWKAPGFEAKAVQQWASPMSAAAHAGPDQYAEEYYNLVAAHPDIAQHYPHPSNYDADVTPAMVDRIGMSTKDKLTLEDKQDLDAARKANWKATADYRNRWNQIRDRLAGIAQQNADTKRMAVTGKAGARGMSQAQMERYAEHNDRLQAEEQKLWKLHEELGDLLDEEKTPDGTLFIDPSGSNPEERTMSAQWRKRLKSAFEMSETQAKQKMEEQRKIRERFGWGEYKGAGPANPPAQPAAQPQQPGAQPPSPAAPAPAAKPAAKKLTEAEARKRAIAAGANPDEAVRVGRARGLVE